MSAAGSVDLPASAALGTKPLNVAAISKRVRAVVEQAKSSPGHRGIESTDVNSFAECRVRLIILALQLVPLLANKDNFPVAFFPDGIAVDRLFESGTEDWVMNDGYFTREVASPSSSSSSGAGAAAAVAIDLHVRCRGKVGNTVLDGVEIRNGALGALAKFAVLREGLEGGSGIGSVTTAAAEAIEKRKKAMMALYEVGGRFHGNVPVFSTNLVHMGILPPMWPLHYKMEANLPLSEEEKATVATASASSSSSSSSSSAAPALSPGRSAPATGIRTGAERDAAIKGSLSTLWWPPASSAITFASALEILRQVEAQKEHQKVAEGDRIREQRARELRARMTGGK